MQKTTQSPATPGPTGPPWYQNRARVTYARHLSRATSAAAVAHAGAKTFMKFSTKYTKMILDFHGNGSIADSSGLKPESTSLQAAGRKNQGHKPRVQASSPSQQAPGSGNPDRGESPQASGHKQPGQKYFFCV